jgi:hypothetical protein
VCFFADLVFVHVQATGHVNSLRCVVVWNIPLWFFSNEENFAIIA